MVYIGYSLSLDEALRLCNITCDYSNPYYRNIANDKLNSYLNNYGLEFHFLDKGVCVIGLRIDKYFGHMSINIDESIIMMMNIKNKIKKSIILAKIDLSNIEIETDLETESVIMNNPEPFFINYRY